MLTNEALKSAMPLTEVLDNSGLYLTAVDNTPLAALVKATRSDDNFAVPTPIGSTAEYQLDTSTIEYIANKKDDVLGLSPHDVAMDEIVEVATKAVQGHLVFAKSVVAPAVQALAEQTAAALKAITPSSLTGMEVVIWSPPKPMENPALETSVRRFEEIPSDSPAMVLALPDRTAAEIAELMLTGTNLDSDIKLWIAERGDAFLIEVWQQCFQQTQAEPNARVVKQFADYVADRRTGPDYALAIYLLARKLTDEPLAGTGMPLALYEQVVVEFRNQAGLRLCYAIDDLDRSKKSGILVLSNTDRTVVVNGPVYREWIAAGGENEVLFGNMLDQPCSITVETIDAKREALLKLWNRHLSLVGTVEANRRFNRTKELLEQVFQAQLRELTEGEEATAANRDTVLALFREQLAEVREDEFSNLYDLSLRLVCRSRFHRTDAERILRGIERVQRENPHIDVREAAAMSLIEYVAYWLSAQFKVSAR